VSLADDITRWQNEEMAKREAQREKCGDYTGEDCPSCGRERIMRGNDGKRRCEKCAWCIEDCDYDFDLSDYLYH
jgi:hypothetical protein